MFGLRRKLAAFNEAFARIDARLNHLDARQDGLRADLADCAVKVLKVNDRVTRHAKGSIQVVELVREVNQNEQETRRMVNAHSAALNEHGLSPAKGVVEALRVELNRKAIAIQDLQDELADARARANSPTWTDSKGRTHQIGEMPTPYIVNCISLLRGKGVTSVGPGSGILNALRDELAERNRCAAAGRVG